MNILNKVTHVFLNLIFIIGWIGFVGFVVFELIFFVPALFQSMNVEVLYWLWLAILMIMSRSFLLLT